MSKTEKNDDNKIMMQAIVDSLNAANTILINPNSSAYERGMASIASELAIGGVPELAKVVLAGCHQPPQQQDEQQN